MEDLVAVKAIDRGGKAHFFMTWGRVFDAVNSEPLLWILAPHLSSFGVHDVTSIVLCDSLQEASTQPYFYEALFTFGQTTIPFGDGYSLWRDQQQNNIRGGKQLYYLGNAVR